MPSYESLFNEKLKSLEASHLYRQLNTPSGLEFHHNDYLGLSQHPEILEAMSRAVSVTGSGSRGSRLLGGNSRLFEETEEKIADLFHAPAALLFSSGFMANLAVLQVLGECITEVVSDEFNHASLIDGIRLSKMTKTVIQHGDWEKVQSTQKPKLFVAEGVYSMEGDLLPRDSFVSSAKRHGAFCHVDEAHSAGVIFENGLGHDLEKELGWQNISKTITFGKAFGVSGAAILCSKQLRELIINRGRSFIYTTAMSPVVLIGIEKALEIVKEEGWRREEIWERAKLVRGILGVATHGTDPEWSSRIPIINVSVPGEERALVLSKNMREFGFDIKAIRFPTVPKGAERLRVTLSLQVSRENTETMAETLAKELDKLKKVN